MTLDRTTSATETPLEALSSLCAVLAVGLFAMTFVFQLFVIPSGSMEKTLLIGDHVLVDRTAFAPPTSWAPFVRYGEPRHGDVIVFLKPNAETPDMVLVKRLIGVPGDRIHLQHGVVFLNGVAQNEPYAMMPEMPGAESYDAARDDFPAEGPPPSTLTTASWTDEEPSHVVGGELVVPPGKVFAMGDNRTHSLDGRYWGFVPRENILGRPLFNYWSYRTTADRMDRQEAGWGGRIAGLLDTATHWFSRTRWDRTFHVIR